MITTESILSIMCKLEQENSRLTQVVMQQEQELEELRANQKDQEKAPASM